ncbi:hypothetical protein LUZ61_013897 [Rhynchospora tenuis]|uniref:Reverse transcriptase n=1 Tax=Rhynchospora tenuis TaxID=198213 RepID=A0AAD5WBD9_9POAL|nr:hypothetical protein LUZ61_013897 [Rhynchospora tenuis]
MSTGPGASDLKEIKDMLASLLKRQDVQEKNTAAIQARLADLDSRIFIPPETSESSTANGKGSDFGGSAVPPRYHRVEFPLFDGSGEPLEWLCRCEQYFRGQRVLEEEKVWLAAYHMTDVAQQWYYKIERSEGIPTWPRFKEACQVRFGPPFRSNPIAELSLLRQSGSVEEYTKDFYKILCRTEQLTPTHEIGLFLSGLSELLRSDVEMQSPVSLDTAVSLARASERHYQILWGSGLLPRPSAQPSRVQPVRPTTIPKTPEVLALPAPQGIGSGERSFRRLTSAEMAERRQKGLCFNCDEQYARGHKCKRLFWLEVMDDDDQEDSLLQHTNETPNISLHALTGIGTSQTMKLQVCVNNSTFIALVDSGSTHNFLSSAAACKLKAELVHRPGVRVRVANGDHLPTAGFCAALNIQIDQENFCLPCYSIALDEFDMVLGVHWLRSLGPILWDFSQLTMTIQRDGHKISWHGVPDPIEASPHSLASTTTDLLSELLNEFADLFKEPQGLPPHRRQDHSIHLRADAEPVAVRPYRYPHIQKDEIEKQCTSMLQQGIIRPSTSPFSSPVLLVKKKDNTWRFCVDYRALNAQTVRNKFPIPVVEELLDELQGSCFFSKLDLRSGYHQVRMHPADVHKTAFRTHHGHFEFLVMPFGLTNAPATFQAVMNEVLQPFLRKFVLVFFDDILVYSQSWSDHLRHLRAVLCLLRTQSLFVKQSKCTFADTSVAYLGHIISPEGVFMDPCKVQAISDWPQPNSTRALRGFLGLAGYYRKFIKNFGSIAVPLNKLLKKEGFQWSQPAEEAFQTLKTALQAAPSLQMPNFDNPFIVECDASGSGIGAVLHQGDRPLAFFSRPIPPHHAKLAAYERELIGLVKAIQHWRPYLWGRAFTVRTDHYSLKFLLDQRLSTIPQHHWVSKLFGFDFSVEYRPGRFNTVADALSRRDVESLALLSISIPQFQLYDLLREEVNTSAAFQGLRTQLKEGTLTKEWSFCDGLFLRQHRIFVPASSPCLQTILTTAHSVGHEGVQKTLHRIRRDFYIPQLKQLVQDFVQSCPQCQRHKVEHLHPAGLLQPLSVPARIWSDIAMDFIEGFPKSHGKSVILTVVDRFSKYAHFIPLAHPYTARSVAQVFFEAIVRLHGIPESIVSDRDTVFTSNFWTELFRLMGVHLNFSSAFHPQSDGQSEVVNRTVEMYLRCLACDRPRQWLQWLPWAEFCYNTSYHTSLRATPFEVVYGRAPPTLIPYSAGTASVQAVDQQLQQRDEFLIEIHNRLLEAQQRMKVQHDKLHRDLEYQVDDWVWVRLHRRHATAITPSKLTKLSPKFYGPYQIKEKIGSVAYRVELPRGARIHNVFHVSLLKTFHGTPPVGPPPLPDIFHGKVIPSPAAVLRSRLARGSRELLVQWQHTPPEDATWVSLDDFRIRYPTFQLEDKLLFKEEGNDIDAFIGQKGISQIRYGALPSMITKGQTQSRTVQQKSNML